MNQNFISKNVSYQLKALAIIFVMLDHLNLRKFLYIPILSNWGTFSVSLFLILSAYGLAISYKNDPKLSNYIYKRFNKVMLPYILVTVLWILVNIMLFKKSYSLSTEILSIAGMDFYRTIDPTMWFITFILLWYIVFYIVFKLPIRNCLKLLLIFLIGLAFKLQNLNCGAPGMFWQWRANAFSFPLGILLGLYSQNIIKILSNINEKNKKFIFAFFAILFSLIFLKFYTLFTNGFTDDNYFFMCIPFSATVISLFILLEKLNIKLPFLTYIGNYSYEIYLFEGAFLDIISIHRILGIHIYSTIIYFMLVFICSLLLQKSTQYLILWNRKGLA